MYYWMPHLVATSCLKVQLFAVQRVLSGTFFQLLGGREYRTYYSTTTRHRRMRPKTCHRESLNIRTLRSCTCRCAACAAFLRLARLLMRTWSTPGSCMPVLKKKSDLHIWAPAIVFEHGQSLMRKPPLRQRASVRRAACGVACVYIYILYVVLGRMHSHCTSVAPHILRHTAGPYGRLRYMATCRRTAAGVCRAVGLYTGIYRGGNEGGSSPWEFY